MRILEGVTDVFCTAKGVVEEKMLDITTLWWNIQGTAYNAKISW